MTTILHAIQTAATDTVEASGLYWQVRKICSADLAKVGFAALAMAGTADPEDGTPATVEQAISRISPKQAEQLAGLQDATVAAGMMAVSEDGVDWTSLRLVLDPTREDADAGVLCVSSLPAGVVGVCFERIMSLSTDNGGAADRLRAFRVRANDAARDLDAREKPRKVAARGPRA